MIFRIGYTNHFLDSHSTPADLKVDQDLLAQKMLEDSDLELEDDHKYFADTTDKNNMDLDD